jgi:catechol 2,3-dioxygenase-like lactoylglutathione lyase family enzyme
MKILFVAGFGPIITDLKQSKNLYVKTLGLPLTEEDDHYFHTDKVDGVKHFALWPLSQAAVSCFGDNKWPDDVPTPNAWVEFDVDDIAAATKELKAAGYKLLVATRTEPWGQTVTRFLSPEGILTGITYTPSMRSKRAKSR